VDRGVVAGVDPGGQQPVQLGQPGDRGRGLLAELDQELLADRAEKSLDLPAALRLSG